MNRSIMLIRIFFKNLKKAIKDENADKKTYLAEYLQEYAEHAGTSPALMTFLWKHHSREIQESLARMLTDINGNLQVNDDPKLIAAIQKKFQEQETVEAERRKNHPGMKLVEDMRKTIKSLFNAPPLSPAEIADQFADDGYVGADIRHVLHHPDQVLAEEPERILFTARYFFDMTVPHLSNDFRKASRTNKLLVALMKLGSRHDYIPYPLQQKESYMSGLMTANRMEVLLPGMAGSFKLAGHVNIGQIAQTLGDNMYPLIQDIVRRAEIDFAKGPAAFRKPAWRVRYGEWTLKAQKPPDFLPN